MYAIFKEEIFEKAKKIYNQHKNFESGNINLKQLKAYQENKLREIIKYVSNNSLFWAQEYRPESMSG
ncbi:hypothetical protein [Oceanimonas smirnovii]|uniref:hypothetical protein n=1 Tax=Oceanimonas smirnovii TaxID=264574 RepID=UPI003FD6BB2A